MSDQISLGVALTAVGMLVGGGVVWGALRQTVNDLSKLLTRVETQCTKLEAEVVKLRAEVVELRTEVSIMKAVDVAVGEVTARHESQPHERPIRPMRDDPRRDR